MWFPFRCLAFFSLLVSTACELGEAVAYEWIDFQAADIRVGYRFRPIPQLIISHVSGNVVGLGLLEAPAASTLMRPSFKIEIIG